MDSEIFISDRACDKCRARVGVGSVLPLWDGKRYCEDCISAASPLLAKHVRNGTCLERMIINPREAGRAGLKNGYFASAVLLVVFCISAWRGGHFDARGGAWSWTLFAILAPFAGMSKNQSRARGVKGSVEVKDGQVTVWHPSFKKRFLPLPCSMDEFVVPLRDCRWYVGKLDRAWRFSNGVSLQRQVIILKCHLREHPQIDVVDVPCGFNDGSRAVWEAFLTLAGIPRDPNEGEP